jgi:hypothetical protein
MAQLRSRENYWTGITHKLECPNCDSHGSFGVAYIRMTGYSYLGWDIDANENYQEYYNDERDAGKLYICNHCGYLMWTDTLGLCEFADKAFMDKYGDHAEFVEGLEKGTWRNDVIEESVDLVERTYNNLINDLKEEAPEPLKIATERIIELEQTVKRKEKVIAELSREIQNLEVDLEAQASGYKMEKKAYGRVFDRLGITKKVNATVVEEYWRVYWDEYIDGRENDILNRWLLEDAPAGHPLLKIANEKQKTHKEEID